MHFVHGAVNRLTKEEFDPRTKIPEYKVTNVQVQPLGKKPAEDPTSPEELTRGGSESLADDD